MTWNDSGNGCFLKNPDSRGTLVRPWLRRCRHSQTSFRGQARMSENTGLGILAHCTSRGRRGTLEPVMRYFVAGAGLGRFRSLIPCACHATDSQHTVNTTVNTQSTRQSTASTLCTDCRSKFSVEALYISHNTAFGQLQLLPTPVLDWSRILKVTHSQHDSQRNAKRFACRILQEKSRNARFA